MLNFFKKKETGIASPVSGKCIPTQEVPDEVFSTKMPGDGFAVEASKDTVVAPVSVELVMVAV